MISGKALDETDIAGAWGDNGDGDGGGGGGGVELPLSLPSPLPRLVSLRPQSSSLSIIPFPYISRTFHT